MDRVRKISNELMNKFPNRFGIDFELNKKTVMELAKITSKQLRNQIAGFITSYLRKEAKSKESLESESSSNQEIMTQENTS
ncbi:MAG: 30S ribosomal protein S17e [Candidatus Eiseniibacteriota bacterium]|jgi:small subunit ribosomal protein S17e